MKQKRQGMWKMLKLSVEHQAAGGGEEGVFLGGFAEDPERNAAESDG